MGSYIIGVSDRAYRRLRREALRARLPLQAYVSREIERELRKEARKEDAARPAFPWVPS